MKEFNDHLGLALLELYTADKYLYNVAARLNIIAGDDIPDRPEVRGYTDGVTIFFTDAWMQADQTTRWTTLTHEVGHVINKHFDRVALVSEYDHMKMNVAADLSMMEMQMQLGQTPAIQGVIPEWRRYLNMDMFEIYALLDGDEAKQDLGHPEIGPGFPGEASDEKARVPGFSLPKPSPEAVFSVDKAIEQAAIQAENAGYSTAASRAANRLISTARSKPIRWDQYLTQVAARLKSDLFTWIRPNRRLMSQVYLPSRIKKPVFEATVAMDVSGSVGQGPLNQIGAIAQELLTRYVSKLHLITFDDKIVDEWDLTRRDKIVNLSLNGYGGTYVQKVYDHLKKTKRNPKLLIIATDGYVPDTKDPGYRVIWLIVDNPGFKSTYGTILHVNTGEL